MAVSCPEVMYGAYYPYLYGRGAARSFHHAPHFQYTDRLNVGSGTAAGNGGGGSEAYGGGGGALSSGSASSGGGSPPAPAAAPGHQLARLRAKEEEVSAVSRHSPHSSESEGECGGSTGGTRDLPPCAGAGARPERARAQYVSANCVVFTHYSGDVASVVDEHFARALAIDKHKESVPMVSRNLPASFFNASCVGGGGAGGNVEVYEYDPWQAHYGAHYGAGQYAAHAHAHAHQQMAQAAAAGGYGGLLLAGRGALHAQYKPVEWGAHHSAHHAAHHAAAAHLDPAVCAPYYPPVPARPLYQTGLEAQVQDTSKDLYWF